MPKYFCWILSKIKLNFEFFIALNDHNKWLSESSTSTFILTFLSPRVASGQCKLSHVNFSTPPDLQAFSLGVWQPMCVKPLSNQFVSKIAPKQTQSETAYTSLIQFWFIVVYFAVVKRNSNQGVHYFWHETLSFLRYHIYITCYKAALILT